MNYQLHTAGFIEETLENYGVECRQSAQRVSGGGEIIDQLLRSAGVKPKELVSDAAISARVFGPG